MAFTFKPKDPGRRRRRVKIQSSTIGAGLRPSETWATDATVWASIEPMSGREYVRADKTMASITHIVNIRRYEGLTSKHRLLTVDGSRVLNIDRVIDRDDRDAEQELLCTEAV